jgi:8-oxo-dGTP diphosphatase
MLEAMRLRQRIAVYGICTDDQDRVLLVRAARSLTVRGRWFLPGGGLEHGEDPVSGLHREFEEETGLAVSGESLLGVLSDTATLPDETNLHTVRIIYRVTKWRGELRDEAAGSSDAARWTTRHELATVAVMPYVTEALTRFS